MVRGVFFVGILREFWGLGKFFPGFEKKGNISNLNFAFTRFDTEQWWDGFSWWFWTRAFSSHEHTFWYGLFVLFCLFKTFLLLISLPWMWLGRGAWQPYEISHAHDRRSIGKKRIITYGLDENRSAIFKAWKQGIRKRARNYKVERLTKKGGWGLFWKTIRE